MIDRFDTIILSSECGVATITLNRPASRNALNAQMCTEFADALAIAAKDEEVRLILIRGAGVSFCAGADLKERQGMQHAEVVARRMSAFHLYRAIEDCEKPVIAVVHGAAAGSGLEIAAACDFIVATPDVQFWTPEAQWGSVGATQRLPKIVGKRLAKELMFTGRRMNAQEALNVGLVNRVVPMERLNDELSSISEKIAKAPALAIRLAKSCIDRNMENSAKAALSEEISAIEENLRRSNWKQAIETFGAKNASIS